MYNELSPHLFLPWSWWVRWDGLNTAGLPRVGKEVPYQPGKIQVCLVDLVHAHSFV